MNSLLSLCALLITIMQTAGSPAVSAPETAPAETPNTSYTDTGLQMTFRYPDGFIPHPEMLAAFSQQAFADGGDAERARQAKCMSLPAVALKGDASGNPDKFGMLFFVRVDLACQGQTRTPDDLAEDAQQLTQMLSVFGGKRLTEDSVPYQLDGHPAAFVQGSAQAKALGEGRMVHVVSVCSVEAKTEFCWLILDTNHKAMPAAVAMPVSFAGRPAIPLVPKDVVKAW